MAIFFLESTRPIVINTGPEGAAAWLQDNLKYGKTNGSYFVEFAVQGTMAEVQAVAAELELVGWLYEVTLLKGGLARCEARAGWKFNGSVNYSGETPENIWELDAQDSTKSLLDADFPYASQNLTLSSPLTKQMLGQVDGDLTAQWIPATLGPPVTVGQVTANGGAQTYIFDGGDSTGSTISLPTQDYLAAYSLFLLMRAGTNSFPIEASIIRHTQLVSSQYTVQASYANVNRIISSASLASLEGVPSGLLFDIPSSPTPAQYIQYPETAPGLGDGDLQYGWRKPRPQVTRLAQWKWRIVNTYQFGLWATTVWGQTL